MFVNNAFVHYLLLSKLRHNRFSENLIWKELEGVIANAI